MDIIASVTQEISKAVGSNQVVSGGLTLGLVGATIAALRNLPRQIGSWFFTRYISVIHLDGSNDGREIKRLASWLDEAGYTSKFRSFNLEQYSPRKGKVTHRRALADTVELQAVTSWREPISESSTSASTFLAPRDGSCFFRYKDTWMFVRIYQEKQENVHNGNGSGYLTRVEILSLHKDRHKFAQLCIELKQKESDNDVVKAYNFAPSQHTAGWGDELILPRRGQNSVVYKTGLVDNLLGDVRQFLAAETWYNSMGIPWRRGYLFHGLPGNGKTTLAHVLASELQKEIYLLNLAAENLTDAALQAALARAENGIVVLEDIDAIFDGRDNRGLNKLSFSGLLNAIDGIAAKHGQIVVLTTNHIDRLDSALIRPGRCDYHLSVHNADAIQIQAMCRKFFPNWTAPQQTIDALDGKISMAKLQAFMVANYSTPENVAIHWQEFANEFLTPAQKED